MNLHEYGAFGRKIYFIHPSFLVRRNLIPQLCNMEYEIYIIPDYKKAKDILRKNPDSICYINMDVDLRPEGWINFVQSFEKDDVLSTIYIGVTSERTSKTAREDFATQCTLPAGFIQTTSATPDATKIVAHILEMVNAKGQRKYVRASCTTDKNATVTCDAGGKYLTFRLQNISSVGLACLVPDSDAENFQEKSILRNTPLTLGKTQLLCSAVIYAIKRDVQYATMILLFMKGTTNDLKNIIRQYIFDLHQNILDTQLAELAEDPVNYNHPNALQQATETEHPPLEQSDTVHS